VSCHDTSSSVLVSFLFFIVVLKVIGVSLCGSAADDVRNLNYGSSKSALSP
jgi:hypothetical protein